jgi:hypothetical protein
MIENDTQLAATLDYIAKWVDMLEGMRLHEAEQNGGVVPTIAAGPLQEIRVNLDAARTFAHTRSDAPVAPKDIHSAGNLATAPARPLSRL